MTPKHFLYLNTKFLFLIYPQVELHMRYIDLQNMLQTKISELEHVCLREKELLEGKWKTHSLPARKKTVATTPNESMNDVNSPTDSQSKLQYGRPNSSTEDVVYLSRSQNNIIPPPTQYLLAVSYF